MFYLIWEMGILLLLAVGFGVFVGYQLWSGDARSAEADAAIAENARLRQENENLARRLGAAESQARVATPAADPAPAREAAPEIAMPAPEAQAESQAETPVASAAPAAKATVKPKAAAKPKAPSKPKSAEKPAEKPTEKPAPKAKPKAAAKAKPAAQAKPAAAAPGASGEDLGAIKGLGPKAAEALKAGGVTSVAQIAAWSEADIAQWDATINGRGRIVRDDWVGQAKKLVG